MSEHKRPLDVVGLILFSSGTALLSWLLEVFGEHTLAPMTALAVLGVSLGLLLAYAVHASGAEFPLLRLGLFRVRTFRISVLGGFVTRMGFGGLPFLLPLLYQVGMGLPAWESGLLMMPSALAAMGMKLFSQRLLKRFGYRQILIVNTLCIGVTIAAFSQVGSGTPLAAIAALGFMQGFFASMQFSSINTLAYADIDAKDSSMASTMSSSFQQLSMSFGLAAGSLVAGWYLGNVVQTDRALVTNALNHAFLTLGLITAASSLLFWRLQPNDGESISRAVAVG